MPRLEQGGETVARILADQIGLDIAVTRAWVAAESGWQDPATHNYLNLRGADGNFRTFDTAEAAAAAFVDQIQRRGQRPGDWYYGIVQSAGGTRADQVAAIVGSPWDAGHYGGNGQLLEGTLRAVQRSYDAPQVVEGLERIAGGPGPTGVGGGAASGGVGATGVPDAGSNAPRDADTRAADPMPPETSGAGEASGGETPAGGTTDRGSNVDRNDETREHQDGICWCGSIHAGRGGR